MFATVVKAEVVFATCCAVSAAQLAPQRSTVPVPAVENRVDGSVISKASQAADDFARALPNFVCQEVMSRFQSDTPRPIWLPVDVVTSELVFENGKENYR